VLALALAGCRTEGGNLRMLSDARGDGPPLVLVGGILTGWLSWQSHQARLASHRRVVRLQLLSVQLGLENRPLPPGYSVSAESRAMGAALDELGLTEPLDLVGWSSGGMVTLAFALDHPERVRTLTLIEPPAFWVLRATGRMDALSEREIGELHALFRQMRDDVNEDQLAAFLGQAGLCPPGKRPQDLPQWPVWLQHRRSLRTGDAAFAHDDRAERLRSFAAPVLLVKGSGSSHFLHRIIEALAATLPHASSIELPGGHAPQIVSADPFLERLARFQGR
jgi:pimeloyl-ACP methyl ester carboxylesterase